MTLRDDDRTYGRAAGDRVDVAPGVPTDRVRWGPILAGAFAAITALVVLSTLGAAVGMSAYDAGDSARNFAIGAGVWGIISMILAFAIGGWLTARSAAVRGRDNGVLNGFMVAAVGIPLLLFVLGSAATLMGHAAATSSRDMDATPASARIGDTTVTATAQDREEASRRGSRTAWGTLASLILAIGAASAGGYLGAKDDGHYRREHTHIDSGTGTGHSGTTGTV